VKLLLIAYTLMNSLMAHYTAGQYLVTSPSSSTTNSAMP